MNPVRILIAGTHSGVGKTSISLALMAAFKKSGLRVQAFKVGPDYIDPSYHAVATGIPSHNLDSWLLSPETISWLFQEKSKGAELSILEGVMGLYDGFGPKEETASTAELAKMLRCPVILVLDARSLSRSAAATVLGYSQFDPNVKIAGILLNKVGSLNHARHLKESIEHYCHIPVLGTLLRNSEVQIPERILGLQTAKENKDVLTVIHRLSETIQIEPGIDLEKILQIAHSADPLEQTSIPTHFGDPQEKTVRIGYAYDRAFSFYYPANLELLEHFGAEMVPFSPCSDSKLPENLDGLYFGGGFPEIYAEELEENVPIKKEIQSSIARQMPIYAECGGLLYLSESIQRLDEKIFSMIGAIPGKIEMTQKLQNFGYKKGKMRKDTLLGKIGTEIKGHEFHYSKRETPHQNLDQFAYDLRDRKGEKQSLEGFSEDSLLASYLHIHFLSNPNLARHYIHQCKNSFAKC